MVPFLRRIKVLMNGQKVGGSKALKRRFGVAIVGFGPSAVKQKEKRGE